MASLSSDPLFSSGQSNLHRINEQLAAFPSSPLAPTDRDRLDAIIGNLRQVLDQPLAPSSAVKQDLLDIEEQIKRLDPEAFKELGDKLNGLYLLAELGGGGGGGIQSTILSYLSEAAPALASLATVDIAHLRKNPEAFAKWIAENKIPFEALVRELKLPAAEVDKLASLLPSLDLTAFSLHAEFHNEVMKMTRSSPEIPLKNVRFDSVIPFILVRSRSTSPFLHAFVQLPKEFQLQAMRCAFCNRDNQDRFSIFHLCRSHKEFPPSVELDTQLKRIEDDAKFNAALNIHEVALTDEEAQNVLRFEISSIRSLISNPELQLHELAIVVLKDWAAFTGKAGDALITDAERELIRAFPPEREAAFRVP